MTTDISPEDRDEQFRRELKDGFAMFPNEDATVEEVHFEGEYPDVLVQVIFREVNVPPPVDPQVRHCATQSH